MKYENRKKKYFVYTSIIFHLYFLTFVEMKHAPRILLSLKRNIHYLGNLLHTGFDPKDISLENLLQLYF